MAAKSHGLCAVAVLAGAWVTYGQDAPDRLPLDRAGNEQVERHIRNFAGRGAVGDFSTTPKSPEETRKLFELADGLEVQCVLHEPHVRQPLYLDFDARGRMWVVQYIQYPFPAGHKVVKYDEHLRAVFDRVPKPPGHPDHVRGADKITIHEDTDGDGVYDKHKTFIDGLNIATSFAFDRDGLWVLNPPYLLFYEDKNHDDVPDGDPQVHLEGFGLEDTHAVANSLRWGPDGWLYGAQGSTCWATVSSEVTKNVHFKGQAIWRYHPRTKVFEVFAEGGGNTFCVEFDSKGRLYSGTNWGALRGVHYVQGGRYVKNWGKHGPLMNPYSFGFFDHMAHEGYKPRFSHALIIYEGGALQGYEGKMISIIPLHQRVQVSELVPHGSTYKTVDTHAFATNKDTWFRPVAITAGPDGAVYLADWYDTRLTHVDPRDTWDRDHGRIWRIAAKGAKAREPFDFSKLDAKGLISLLESHNKWDRQTAQRLLSADRFAGSWRQLERILSGDAARHGLEALWAYNRKLYFDTKFATMCLEHKDASIRRWMIRTIGDVMASRKFDTSTQPILDKLTDMTETEVNPQVRSQFASSAKRLPDTDGLQIALSMITSGRDQSDPHIPLLLWWAVEDKAVSDRDKVLEMFNTPGVWKTVIGRDVVLPRLAKRYAMDATQENLEALAKLLEAAPDAAASKALLASIEEAFAGRRLGRLPESLRAAMSKAMAAVNADGDLSQLVLRLRAEDDEARGQAMALIHNEDPKVKQVRIEVIETLGQIGHASVAEELVKVALSSKWHSVRRAALSALAEFGQAGIAEAIIAGYNKLPGDQGVREAALDTLSKRKGWAVQLLKAVDAGDIPRTDIQFHLLGRMRLHDSDEIEKLVFKHWGFIRASASDIRKQTQRVREVLAAGEGDAAKGRVLFAASCANCHKLHDQGKDIGPDLTGYERDNLEFMLLSIIDPSAAIREEYINYIAETIDGRIITGFLLEQTLKTVTMEDGQGGRVLIPREDLHSLRASKTSRMPEKLLDEMSDQQVRDLFAYLRSKEKG